MTARQHPNVIVFFTDQQRWDTTGLHGNPMGLTPNFDRLASAGTHVVHCSTCQPVCGPARSSLQTGMYATNTGCPTNGYVPRPHLRGLAHWFGDAGYDTAYIGKWHLGSGREAVPEEERMGYRYWLASNTLEFTSNAYATMMYDNDNRPVRLPGYRADALTDAAIRYIDDARREPSPFFLVLSFIEPHFQNHLDSYPAPVGYRDMMQRNLWIPPDLQALGGTTHQHLAGYYGMCRRLDEALGRLYDALISLGLDEDTLLLFTSDHGCHFKTRNGEYKRSGHESSIRIPTFLHGAALTGGRRITRQVSLVDLPPTLLDAAGLEVPDAMEGRSIMPLVRDARAPWPEEVLIQISESQCGRALRTDRWKYGVVSPDTGAREAHAVNYDEDYLYDLHCDPYELRNLVDEASHGQVRQHLRRRLIERMVEAGEPRPHIAARAGRDSGQRRVGAAEIGPRDAHAAERTIPNEVDM